MPNDASMNAPLYLIPIYAHKMHVTCFWCFIPHVCNTILIWYLCDTQVIHMWYLCDTYVTSMWYLLANHVGMWLPMAWLNLQGTRHSFPHIRLAFCNIQHRYVHERWHLNDALTQPIFHAARRFLVWPRETASKQIGRSGGNRWKRAQVSIQCCKLVSKIFTEGLKITLKLHFWTQKIWDYLKMLGIRKPLRPISESISIQAFPLPSRISLVTQNSSDLPKVFRHTGIQELIWYISPFVNPRILQIYPKTHLILHNILFLSNISCIPKFVWYPRFPTESQNSSDTSTVFAKQEFLRYPRIFPYPNNSSDILNVQYY